MVIEPISEPILIFVRHKRDEVEAMTESTDLLWENVEWLSDSTDKLKQPGLKMTQAFSSIDV